MQIALRNIEGKQHKVSKLVEPLLGYKPSRVKVIRRNNETVHEWYEVEVETALRKMNLDWNFQDELNFYLIPVQAEKEKKPLISLDFQQIRLWVKESFSRITSWLKHQFEKGLG